MTTKLGRNHVVVDGSNIATEGRSMPSLTQLNEAVMAFMADHPGITVTVVVDATFGHRIDKSEVKEFDAAVSNNELVAPPAGAVGRGDAFVLSIANKAGATILSNDSFQEFHGEYDWLFDEGRLIGGKPVPHVGWVFVPRVPVRGPISRKATRGTPKKSDGRRGARSEMSLADAGPAKGRPASKEASQPMPVPKSPPPRKTAAATTNAADAPPARTPSPAPSGGPSDAVNDLMPFLDFVEHHPVGTSVNATVESYSSHGAYVQIGNVRGYVPLRLMSNPPPRSAREAMKVGDAVTVVVASFAPARRSIDCALPAMATGLVPQDPTPVLEAAEAAGATTGRRTRKAAPAAAASDATPRSRRGAKQPVADVAPAEPPSTEVASAAEPAPAPARARKTAAKQAPAKKAAVKQAPAKRAPAKKAAQQPDAAPASPIEPAPVKKAPARKAPAKKATTADDAPTAAPPSEAAPVKKAATRKAPAKKANAAPAKKSAARSTRKSST